MAPNDPNAVDTGDAAPPQPGGETQVFTAPPVVAIPTQADSGANAPPPIGRDPGAVDAAPPEIANAVVPAGDPLVTDGPASPAVRAPNSPDPNAEAQLVKQIVPMLRDSLADVLGVAKDTLTQGATYYAPLIARQALLESSDDEAVRSRAAANRRHLNGQFLMQAAANGIPLQQRQEAKALAVVTQILTLAVSMAKVALV